MKPTLNQTGLSINLEDYQIVIDFSTKEGVELLTALLLGMKTKGLNQQSEFVRELVLNRTKIIELHKAIKDATEDDVEVH
jgi:HKD family nuclease